MTVRPTTTDSTMMSRVSNRRRRRPRRTGGVRGAVVSAVGTGVATTTPTLGNGLGEDALCLILHAAAQSVNVALAVFVDEALERLDDHRLREVRPGVPVQVLRDVLGLGGERRRVLLQLLVPVGGRVRVHRDVAVVHLE